MNWRRVRKWLTIVCVGGIFAIVLVAWFVGGILIAPANRTVGQVPDGFPAKTVRFASESGAELVGWHYHRPDSAATVILLHPIRGDRRSMVTRALALAKRGYSTLLIDMQAHGESTGANITIGFLERYDAIAAVRYVKQANPHHKIAIIGRSLGGAAAVFANPDVEAFVLESVYPTIDEAVHNRVNVRLGLVHHLVSPLLLLQLQPRLGIRPDQLRPIDMIGEIRVPVLVAAGDRDRLTTIDETRRLFAAARAPKELVVFEGAGHGDLLAFDSEKYEDVVLGFIDNALSRE